MRTLTATAALIFLSAPTLAEPAIKVDLGGSAGLVTLWHDSSGPYPTLGSPTSILAYHGLVGPSLSASVQSGLLEPIYFGAHLNYTNIIGGTLRDTDYAKGQVLISETFSKVEGHNFGATVEIAPELLPPLHTDVGDIRLIAIASGRVSQLDALGLDCGARCASAKLGDDVTVIKQNHYTADVGMGVLWQTNLASTTRLNTKASLAVGRARVDDSHVLRKDLGPTPNVIYDLTTVKTSVSAEVEHELSPALAISFSGRVEYLYGAGSLQLGPKLSSPFEAVPAQMSAISGTLNLGLKGHFK